VGQHEMTRTTKEPTTWWVAVNALNPSPGGFPRGSLYRGG
jgi:hypothetical protein